MSSFCQTKNQNDHNYYNAGLNTIVGLQSFADQKLLMAVTSVDCLTLWPSIPVFTVHYFHLLSVALMVQFDPITYAVTEGEQASVLAVLNFASNRDVSVDFATGDLSAIGN